MAEHVIWHEQETEFNSFMEQFKSDFVLKIIGIVFYIDIYFVYRFNL